MGVIPKSWIATGTLLAIWDRLAWAFNALTDGRLPARDWNNRPLRNAGRELCGGWRFACIFCIADWEFNSSYCQFPTSTSKPECCWKCRASPSQGVLCWCNVADDAPWRNTKKSHEDYLATRAAKGLPPARLFLIRTLKLEGFLGDPMHCMDEGITPEIIGNIAWEVMELKQWGTTQESNAVGLENHLNKHYADTNEKVKIQGKLTKQRIKESSEWPIFKAKAAATRHCVPWAVKLATEFNSNSLHDRRRLAVIQCLNRIYDLIREAPQFPSPEQQAELRELSLAMMRNYRHLTDESLGLNVKTWKMKPKCHMTQHILEEESWINPRSVWLYGDEDLQRLIKLVAVQCHPRTVAYMCLYRWLLKIYGEPADEEE